MRDRPSRGSEKPDGVSWRGGGESQPCRVRSAVAGQEPRRFEAAVAQRAAVPPRARYRAATSKKASRRDVADAETGSPVSALARTTAPRRSREGGRGDQWHRRDPPVEAADEPGPAPSQAEAEGQCGRRPHGPPDRAVDEERGDHVAAHRLAVAHVDEDGTVRDARACDRTQARAEESRLCRRPRPSQRQAPRRAKREAEPRHRTALRR